MKPNSHEAEVRRLRDEVEILREENRQLRERLDPSGERPAEWKLTPSQDAVLRRLLGTPGVVAVGQLAEVRRMQDERRDDIDEARLVRVIVSHLRKKVPGIIIQNFNGRGYALTEGSKALLRAALLPPK